MMRMQGGRGCRVGSDVGGLSDIESRMGKSGSLSAAGDSAWGIMFEHLYK